MRHIALALALFAAGPAWADDTARIGHVNTAATNLGLTRSHQVVVERFNDPEMPNVSCFVSQARTGGCRAWSAWRRDPARIRALACHRDRADHRARRAAAGRAGGADLGGLDQHLLKETRVHARGRAAPRAGLSGLEHAADRGLAAQRHAP
jgi:CreA protein